MPTKRGNLGDLVSDHALVRCSNCGSSFTCNPVGDCWCKAPPYLPMPAAGETCLCPSCLAKARAAAQRAEDA